MENGTANAESLSLEERIRLRAHELYVERGYQSGFDLDDWLRAQEEVLAAEEHSPYLLES